VTGDGDTGATESEMSEHEDRDDGRIREVAELLRAAEPAAPDFTTRLMAVVNAEAGRAMAQRSRSWWRRRRTVQLSLSPLGALAAAAVLVAFAVLGTISVRRSSAPPARVALDARADTVHVVRFVFLAPDASSVTMVGNFNDWNRRVTPLRRTGAAGTWAVSVPLPPGPHQYAFIVDGTTWTPDPAAATTVTDDFGTKTSVIAVGGAS
jgi:hypothetical protein